jgi:hypothetical protein
MQRAQLRSHSDEAAEVAAVIAKLNASCLPETTLKWMWHVSTCAAIYLGRTR